MTELEPEQAHEELVRVTKCQARTQEQVTKLAGKLETVSALMKSAWSSWQRDMAMLLASGGLAGFKSTLEVLEYLWQPLCRLNDGVGAADAVQTQLYERNLCQVQDHFYWQSQAAGKSQFYRGIMDHLLNGLAARLGQGPFVADQVGSYHLCTDGWSILLLRRGDDLLLESPLEYAPLDPQRDQWGLLWALLPWVAGWNRRYPQAIVLSADGHLLLQVRLGLDGLDPERLERALAAQMGLLEVPAPEPEPLPCGLPPQVPVWRS